MAPLGTSYPGLPVDEPLQRVAPGVRDACADVARRHPDPERPSLRHRDRRARRLGRETPRDRALADPGSLGERVLIYDETGLYLPLGLADLLAAGGARVDVVTPDLYVGATVLATSEQPYLFPRLAAAGVTMTAQCGLEEIGPDGEASLVHAYDGRSERKAYSAIVLAQYRAAVEELWLELDGQVAELHRIGDCLAPRRTAVAIYEGEQLGREL